MKTGPIFVLAATALGIILWVGSIGLTDAQAATNHCAPLPAPGGRIIHVSNESQLWTAVNTAQPGDTILLADGTYHLGQNGYYVWIDTPNVTLRSASGDREAVILDDNWSASETISILASHATIADLTIQRAGTHSIHVMSSDSGDTVNTLIYNVYIVDPGQQAIKINPHSAQVTFPNFGEIACSHLEMTDAGRSKVLAINGSCYTGGVDAHTAQGWVIRDNRIEGFWCGSGGLSEHGIHLWSNSRDTLVERNQLINNARGIGFGLGSSGHNGGIIRNNMVHTIQDVGIGLESAPGSRVYNNTVYTENYFNAVEYRFSATSGVEIFNNLTNVAIASRDGATGTVQNNLTNAQLIWFMNAARGDLHLAANIASVVDQAQTLAWVSDDFDGDSRPIGPAPDIGADEYGDPPPGVVTNLRVTETLAGTGSVTVTLGWSPPLTAQSQMIRYSSNPITEANWESATLLTDSLSGNANQYQASVPLSGGTLYFAQRSYHALGGWSALSNNAFWPHFDIYLPLVSKPNTNPVHQGIATYYSATGDGACMFGTSPGDLMVTAMNAAEYDNAAYCGATLHVIGPKGSVTVRVVDLCPECQAGHLDLSQEAFAQIADLYLGRVNITWQLISPALNGPVAYHFKDGSNQWWTAVQIRNHRNPIAKFEYLNSSGQWVNVPRTSYNYFVQTNPGMGLGPYAFRVTDWYGNQLTDSGIPHLENGTVSGAAQFPPGP